MGPIPAEVVISVLLMVFLLSIACFPLPERWRHTSSLPDHAPRSSGRKSYPATVSRGRSADQSPVARALLSGTAVVLPGLRFAACSSILDPQSVEALRELGSLLKERPSLHVRIEGHTDNLGSPASNRALSFRRARSVVAYLTEHCGIASDRLSPVGLGPGRPVAPDVPGQRERNRRVELHALSGPEAEGTFYRVS